MFQEPQILLNSNQYH